MMHTAYSGEQKRPNALAVQHYASTSWWKMRINWYELSSLLRQTLQVTVCKACVKPSTRLGTRSSNVKPLHWTAFVHHCTSWLASKLFTQTRAKHNLKKFKTRTNSC